MIVSNPLEQEPIVSDIITEYNITLKNLEEVNAILENYEDNNLKTKKIEETYRNIIKGPSDTKHDDVLKDDDSLDF